MTTTQSLVAIVVGSHSDWDIMHHAAETLRDLQIDYFSQIISAHRTPDVLFDFATGARAQGFEVIIAGAGGAAHLPGMLAAKCSLPILGVPIPATLLNGMDSLLSIVQMPAGVPVGTLAIGKSGAINAALLAAAILGNKYAHIRDNLEKFRTAQTQKVISNSTLEQAP